MTNGFLSELKRPGFGAECVLGSLLEPSPFGVRIGTRSNALVAQANAAPIQVAVGFADSSSASPNFPEPWNESNALINFVGGGTVYRSGAIRLDNLTASDITVENVAVALSRPVPVFRFWSQLAVPAHASTL